MRFEQPLYLALLLAPLSLALAPALAPLPARTRSRPSGSEAAGARAGGLLLPGILRVLGLTCLILALAGPILVLPARDLAVAVIVDRSASMEPALGQVTASLNAWLATQRPDVQAAVISTSGRAELERPLQPLPQAPITAWQSPVQREASDLAAALRLAAAALPHDAMRRVVLISDGRPTAGDALAEAQLLAAAGIRLDVVPVNPVPGPDLAVRDLRVPAAAVVDRPVQVEVAVSVEAAARVDVRLYAGDALAAEQTVDLTPGEHRLAFTVTPRQSGPLPIRAEVATADGGADAEPANNRYDAVLPVTGPPAALVLTHRPDGPLVESLRAQQIPVDVRGPAQRPADLAGWARYALVVIDDVAAAELGETAMAEIERYVRDLGGGLVMSGGPNAFGIGGYLGSPVERALPVYMDLRSKQDLPTVALALVIDSSGSMSGLKLDMAVEAAVRTAQMLTPVDRLGVILFDSEAYVTRRLSPVDTVDEVRAAFPATAAGGTALGAGLDAAWEMMRDAEADIRHVIALTDGVSAPFDVTGSARRFRDAGITLSTVAVGSDADAAMLRALAEAGGGGYYEALDPTQLPTLITRDAVLATRSFTVEETFVPRPSGAAAAETGAGTLLRGVTAGAGTLPALHGYVAASPKPRADVVLWSHRDDPILAAWQYGAGRAVAWTSDAAGRWSGEWLAAGGTPFARLWANVLDWAASLGTGPSAAWSDGGGDAAGPGGGVAATTLTANVVVGDGGYEAVIEAGGTPPPGGRVRLVPGGGEAALVPVAPDRSEARIPVDAAGVYGVVVELDDASQLTTALAVPYPAEFRRTGADPLYLQALAAVTGGTVLDTLEEALSRDLPAPVAERPLWPYALLAAAILLPLDVAARRLGWRALPVPRPLRRWAPFLPQRRGAATPAAPGSTAAPDPAGPSPDPGGAPEPAAPPPTTMERLKAARQRARERQEERVRRHTGRA